MLIDFNLLIIKYSTNCYIIVAWKKSKMFSCFRAFLSVFLQLYAITVKCFNNVLIFQFSCFIYVRMPYVNLTYIIFTLVEFKPDNT